MDIDIKMDLQSKANLYLVLQFIATIHDVSKWWDSYYRFLITYPYVLTYDSCSSKKTVLY